MSEGQVRLRSRTGENWSWSSIPEPEVEKPRHGNGSFFYLSPYYSILVLAVGFTLYKVISLGHSCLPTPLAISDEISHPNSFIAERALIQLRHLTSLGSKPVGSYENEVLAVDFLTREISFIIQQARSVHRISLDIQKPTGSYYLAFQPYGFTNYYTNIQNVVVKLSSENSSSSSLLINCHFDSVPSSPGGSDDGLNCAVMLEVLRVLSKAEHPLKHNVIFLFNGAEETPLQAVPHLLNLYCMHRVSGGHKTGLHNSSDNRRNLTYITGDAQNVQAFLTPFKKGSHGFISQHKWAHEVKAFINLESCGAGGGDVLFQVGPNHSWLVQMYADSVPHPHGFVLAEEIFQSGLIPSDTDFRVFRDFGKIPGLDFAHYSNGYVYHTSFDNMDHIPQGTFQYSGDNLLALTKKLASSVELENPDKYNSGRAVYFDIFRLWMVTYSEFEGIGLNIFTALLSIYTQMNTLMAIGRGLNHGQLGKLFLLTCSLTFLGWLLGIGVAVAIAILLDVLNSSMSWYSCPVFIFGLYFCPVLASCLVFPVILNRYRNRLQTFLCPAFQAQLCCNSVQLLWTVTLLIATLYRIRSAFILMLMVLIPAVSSMLLIVCKQQRSSHIWLSVYVSSTVIPISYILYQTMMTYSLFIPITGRIGPTKNPELIVGILSAILCIMASSYITPLIVLLKNPGRVLIGLSIIKLLMLGAAVLTPLGFPYSGNPSAPTPQRILIYHTERTFYDPLGHIRHNDSGYWLVNMDRHSPNSVCSLIQEVANAQSVKPFCDTELYCGLPVYSPRLLFLCEHTHWIPASRPVIHNPTSLELVSQKMVSMNTRRLSFSVSGPDHMGVFLSPFSGVKLVHWSFGTEIPSGEPKWKDRSTYFIHYGHGLMSSTWKFWFEFEVPSPRNTTIVDIAVAGHYMNNAHENSPEFKHFLNKYPNWAHMTAWTASYKSWKF